MFILMRLYINLILQEPQSGSRTDMKINSYTKDDIVILEPMDKIMGGPDVGDLDRELYSLLGKGHKKVVIDFSKTPWIGSSVISILLHHHKKFKNTGGNLKLANPTEKIKLAMTIAKLTSVFELYESLEKALDSYKDN